MEGDFDNSRNPAQPNCGTAVEQHEGIVQIDRAAFCGAKGQVRQAEEVISVGCC